MERTNKKQPYSFSFTPNTIDNLRHYINTHPKNTLSKKVEQFLQVIIPDMKDA